METTSNFICASVIPRLCRGDRVILAQFKQNHSIKRTKSYKGTRVPQNEIRIYWNGAVEAKLSMDRDVG